MIKRSNYILIEAQCHSILKEYNISAAFRHRVSCIAADLIYGLYNNDEDTIITNIDRFFIDLHVCSNELDNLLIALFRELDVV